MQTFDEDGTLLKELKLESTEALITAFREEMEKPEVAEVRVFKDKSIMDKKFGGTKPAQRGFGEVKK